jgi:hypothetical protein
VEVLILTYAQSKKTYMISNPTIWLARELGPHGNITAKAAGYKTKMLEKP